MTILGKFLMWMEERFGRFLLPVDFDQLDTPNQGKRIEPEKSISKTDSRTIVKLKPEYEYSV